MDMNGGNREQVKRRLTPEQKQKILRMRRMRKLKRRLMFIVPAALVLIIALVLILTLGGKEDKPANTDAIASTTPLVSATATPEPTQAPTKFVFDDAYIAAINGQSTGPAIKYDLSKVAPDMLGRWPMTNEGYIPIVAQANTNEKIIAITVDDCFQNANLQQIVQCALDYNGKLTIFPIGDNLTKSNIAATIKWAWENGMEIENHTYNHVGLYQFDDERMMQEIWYQNRKVSEVLGVDYQMHFFRPRGGDERKDQRIHAFVQDMGYHGIAHWAQSGSNSPLDDLLANLAPGKIYLFHTTDHDLDQLLQFIPAVTQAGYRLVTLNEMFGLPTNEIAPYTADKPMPVFDSFEVKPIPLQKTVYTRAAAVVQKRLIELGWLSNTVVPDGIFGNTSYMATGFFQKAHGLESTGIMDVDAQKLLFSGAAKMPTAEQLEEMKKAAK